MAVNSQLFFYIRKFIFTVLLPTIIALFSFTNIASVNPTFNHIYKYQYIYITTLVFLYTGINYTLEYIFSLTSVDVMFKQISINNSTYDLLYTGEQNCYNIIKIKKIYKLKYINYKIIRIINLLGWVCGITCPIILPTDIIHKFNSGDIENTLHMLQTYTATENYNLDDDLLLEQDNTKIQQLQNEIFN